MNRFLHGLHSVRLRENNILVTQSSQTRTMTMMTMPHQVWLKKMIEQPRVLWSQWWRLGQQLISRRGQPSRVLNSWRLCARSAQMLCSCRWKWWALRIFRIWSEWLFAWWGQCTSATLPTRGRPGPQRVSRPFTYSKHEVRCLGCWDKCARFGRMSRPCLSLASQLNSEQPLD